MTESLQGPIEKAINKFYLNEQGKAPGQVEVEICDHMVVIRTSDVFTNTERDLADTSEGKKLIQSARRDQRALTRRRIETEISRIMGRSVPRSFYDIDTRVGEQVEVYILE